MGAFADILLLLCFLFHCFSCLLYRFAFAQLAEQNLATGAWGSDMQ